MNNIQAILCVLIALAIPVGCSGRNHATPIDASPTIGSSYSPVSLLNCANELIKAGPDKAYAILKAESEKGPQEYTDSLKHQDKEGKIVLLAAVLYRPESKMTVLPKFGMPNFGGTMTIVAPSANILVFQDDIPFLTVSGFLLAGLPQSSLSFLDSCRQAGEFRKSLYHIPNRQQATDALNTLCRSNNWPLTQFFQDQVDRITETK